MLFFSLYVAVIQKTNTARVRPWMVTGGLLMLLWAGGVDATQREVQVDAASAEKSSAAVASEDEGFDDVPVLTMLSRRHTGAVLQSGVTFFPDEALSEQFSFFVSHARLTLVRSVLDDRVALVLSGDGMSGTVPLRRTTRLGGDMAQDGETAVPILLDANAVLWLPVIRTQVRVGRMIPPWGVFMETPVSQLGAVTYPLYIHGNTASLGVFRNVGMDSRMALGERVAVEFGVYNGGRNSWLDEDAAKNVLTGLTVSPLGSVMIRGSVMFTFDDVHVSSESADDSIDETQVRETGIAPVVEVRFRDYGFDGGAGAAMRVSLREGPHPVSTEIAFGGFVQAGVMVLGDWFELFARVDYFDPSSTVLSDAHLRFTAGPHFYLTDRMGFLKINYLFERFSSRRAMCQNYLEFISCEPQAIEMSVPSRAKKYANSLYVTIGIDI